MHSKKCSNCGNDNDPLLTNCIFCKSPLPVIDLSSIPNEELVLNAGEWIGKLKNAGYVSKTKNANAWIGRGIRGIEKSEIEGNALKYLSLLEIRASTNINLTSTINNLRGEFEKNRKTLSRRQRALLFLVIFYIVIALLLFIAYKF